MCIRDRFDAVAAAKARKADILICDTAGRLHNKKNLMEELKKINRILDKEFSDAYKETLVVLDGTTGQNALAQARELSLIHILRLYISQGSRQSVNPLKSRWSIITTI